MEKLVVLTLTGDNLQKDIHVTLQIWQEGGPYLGGSEGLLPPCPDLLIKYQQWQSTLRSLAPSTVRMKIKINTKGDAIEKFYHRQRDKWYADCQQAESDLVELINTWLESDTFRKIQDKLHAKIKDNDQVRVILSTGNLELKKLPWHHWQWLNRNNCQAEIIFGNIDCQPSPIVITNKLKILVILGNSDGIDIQTDLDVLSKNLPKAEIKPLIKPTLKELNEYLWNQSWDILFFAGHSETDENIGKIYINDAEFIEIKDLRYALQEAISKGLKLAIFNSCDGLGLAYELERLNIPNLIVMRDIVPDAVAQQFLQDLIKSFAIKNKPLHLAELEARKRLKGLEKSFPSASWMPVIYQNLANKMQFWQDWVKTPKPPSWKGILTIFGTSLAVTSVIIGARSLSIFQPIETFAYDLLISQQAQDKPSDDRILIVEVNQKEMNKYANNLNYLPNEILVELIKKIDRYQPRAIGIDIFRDRVKLSQELLELFHQKDYLIAVSTIGDQKRDPIKFPKGIPFKQVGFADLELDNDKIVRRQLLSAEGNYAFSFLLAFHYLNAENVKLLTVGAAKDKLKFGNIIFQRLDTHTRGYIHLDGQFNQILRSFRANFSKAVSITQVLDDQVDSNEIKDKVIIIGITDPTIQDDHQTPLGRMRGLFIHAQMVSQILSIVKDKQLQISILPLWLEYLYLYIYSLIIALIVWRLRSVSQLLIFNVAIVICLYLTCVYFITAQALWLPLGSSVIILFMAEGTLLVQLKFQLLKLPTKVSQPT